MEVKDIIAKGRPSASVAHLPEFRYDGYEYALEEFENNRLKACDNQTPEQAWRETEFVVPFVKEHHRTPTFSDAIEVTRKQIIDKICKWLEEHLYDDEYLVDADGCLINIDSLINGLKKAMEE